MILMVAPNVSQRFEYQRHTGIYQEKIWPTLPVPARDRAIRTNTVRYKMIRLIATVAVSLALSACGKPSTADYQAIHKDGLRKISYASDLEAQYQQVDHFITHFGFGKQPLIWSSEAFIHDRFILTLQIPVSVDYAKRTVSIAGDPKFFLHAIARIDILPDGRASTRYDGDLQRHFGLAEWTKFKVAGFDLSALGIPATEIRPEKNFDAYVASLRKDRVPIK